MTTLHEPPTTTRFRIAELDCAEEARAIRQTLEGRPGVRGVNVDILRGEASIEHDEAAIDSRAIIAAMRTAGLTASIVCEETCGVSPAAEEKHRGNGLLVFAGICGLGLVAGVTLAAARSGVTGALFGEASPGVAAILCFSLAAVSGLVAVAPKTFAAVRGRRADMNVLMTVAVIGALALGEWLEAATVSFLFVISLLLEQWSLNRARTAIESLMNLTPPTARRKETGDAPPVDVPVEEISAGEVVIVRPGERVPLDGEVAVGTSTINEAPITGESLPVDKQPGDVTYAGTINGDGLLEVRVTAQTEQSMLARMVRLIHQSQARRAPQEQWIEKFAARYTPAMIALAIIIALVPPLFAGGWMEWLYRGLVVLVIACPCALVISTPVTLVSALASSARRGVLVKGGRALEAAASIMAIAMDKTGTLTHGVPNVSRVVPLSGHSDDELLARAAALGAPSTHPLSQAVVRHAAEAGIAAENAEEYQALVGRGAEAKLAGRDFWIGSHRFLHEKVEEPDEVHRKAVELEQSGETVVGVGNDNHVCGLLGISDRIREESLVATRRLRELGIKQIVLLTGDHEFAAARVAEATGVDSVQFDLLPEDKASAIERLRSSCGPTAMIGDGVNDAPALAAADLGVAMGALGTDAAIETADVALMNDELDRVPWLIQHARAAMGIVRFNVGFSLAIKAAFLGLSAFGLATLWMAIAADTGATLLVTANGLRMLRGREA